MTVYKYIFDFFYYLIDRGLGYSVNLNMITFEIGGTSIPFNQWLCHTLTIIVIILIAIFFIKLTIWLFKIGANLFKW